MSPNNDRPVPKIGVGTSLGRGPIKNGQGRTNAVRNKEGEHCGWRLNKWINEFTLQCVLVLRHCRRVGLRGVWRRRERMLWAGAVGPCSIALVSAAPGWKKENVPGNAGQINGVKEDKGNNQWGFRVRHTNCEFTDLWWLLLARRQWKRQWKVLEDFPLHAHSVIS